MAAVTRLYDTYDEARAAVVRLESAGIPHSDISIVANDADKRYSSGIVDRDRDGTDDRAEGAGTGAGLGAAAGGAAGLLAGLGLLAIPGIGPVVAAGWLASTALGAAVGASAGGLIGALTQAGVSEEHAHVYAEGIRRGGTLLTVRTAEAERARVEQLLTGGVDFSARAESYRKSGWKQFDTAAPPMTADEIRRNEDLGRRV
jgi:uncharacterized membrane protein